MCLARCLTITNHSLSKKSEKNPITLGWENIKSEIVFKLKNQKKKKKKNFHKPHIEIINEGILLTNQYRRPAGNLYRFRLISESIHLVLMIQHEHSSFQTVFCCGSLLFLLSVFILWFIYYVSDIFCKF